MIPITSTQNLIEFQRKQKKRVVTTNTSFVAPNLDATIDYDFNMESSLLSFDSDIQKENERINLYRKMARHHNIEDAIQDIVNEVVVIDNDLDSVVTVSLERTDFSESIVKKIRAEFEHILRLLDFEFKCDELFKKYYVDGRLGYHKVVNKNNERGGIVKLNPLDPRNLKKIRKVVRDQDTIKEIKEYFLYDESIYTSRADEKRPTIKRQFVLDEETVAYIHSGLIDEEDNQILGFLEKAIKPWNQLNMMEDASVIYRIVRAPERRLFYIDTGQLPTKAAHEFVNKVKSRYNSKVTYDPINGTMSESTHQSVMDNYWFPRREGSRGTEVDTLPGAENLNENEDIILAQKRLYKSLDVPVTRLESDAVFNSRPDEITRDELKFSKRVLKLRKKFSQLFSDILETQLVLKGVITQEEWDSNAYFIKYQWNQDVYITQQRNMEMMQQKVDLADAYEGYVGKYFSENYIQTKIFGQSEDEIKDEKAQIKAEGSSEEHDEDNNDDGKELDTIKNTPTKEGKEDKNEEED